MQIRAMVLAIPLAAVLILATTQTSAKADTTRVFLWNGVWGWPDCWFSCDPVQSGCLINPDCHCDCLR